MEGPVGVEPARNKSAKIVCWSIGFGPGAEIERAAKLATCGFVAGIDPSPVMLRQATRRNQRYILEGRVELQRATMNAIPYPNTSFDKVFGINCIQFFSRPSPRFGRDSPRVETERACRSGNSAALEGSE